MIFFNSNKCEKCGTKIRKTEDVSFKYNVKLCPACTLLEDKRRKNRLHGYFGRLEERIAYYLFDHNYYNPEIDLRVEAFDKKAIEKIKLKLTDSRSIEILIELFENFIEDGNAGKMDIASYCQIVRELFDLYLEADVIKSNDVYSPQAFLEAVTGKCYCFNTKYPIIKQIEDILKEYCFKTDNYSLKETISAIKVGKPLVLVDCTDVGEENEIKHEYRWFFTPNNFKE